MCVYLLLFIFFISHRWEKSSLSNNNIGATQIHTHHREVKQTGGAAESERERESSFPYER